MIRCTIELLPGGNEQRAKTLGLVEICNIGVDENNYGKYAVVLKKCYPFKGALVDAWKKGHVTEQDKVINGALTSEDDELIVTEISGHHRTKRGVYDLLYRALRACGLEVRNP